MVKTITKKNVKLELFKVNLRIEDKIVRSAAAKTDEDKAKARKGFGVALESEATPSRIRQESRRRSLGLSLMRLILNKEQNPPPTGLNETRSQ